MTGPGRPARPIPPESPAFELATYLRELRTAAGVTYRQMAATVPCKHNTLSQTVNGRLTGWEPVRTFLKALRDAAEAGAVPDDAESRARLLWEEAQARRRRGAGEPAALVPESVVPESVVPESVVPESVVPESPVEPPEQPAPEPPGVPAPRRGGRLRSLVQRVTGVIKQR